MEFTLARFIRIRLQGMHTTKNAANNIQWLVDHSELNKRSFYSLKYIKIGARLNCNGHALSAKQYNGDEVSLLSIWKFSFSNSARILGSFQIKLLRSDSPSNLNLFYSIIN